MNTFHSRLAWRLVLPIFCAGGVPALAQDMLQGPDTLFLTWFRDPTTTIVAQYLEEGDPVPLVEGASDEVPAFDTPRVSGIVIDGRADDWVDRGFEAGLMHSDALHHMTTEQPSVSATARIGWDERGLLVMIRVKDDSAVESGDIETLWAGDSVECFVSSGVGSDERYQALIAPGADEKQTASRQWQYDYRKQRVNELAFESACEVVEGGYNVEVLLPWRNLGVEEGGPKQGDTFAFQFYVNDVDPDKENTRGVWWHPDRDAHENPDSMYSLRLVGEDQPSSKPVRAWAMIGKDLDLQPPARDPFLSVVTDESLLGKTLVATYGGHEVMRGEVVRDVHGDASMVNRLADPSAGKRWGTIIIEADGEPVAYAKAPAWMKSSPPKATRARIQSLAGEQEQTADGRVTAFDEDAGLYLHRFEFDGLKPAGEYQIEIEGYDMKPLRFRTAPAVMDGPFVFAEGGDVGTGSNVAPLHKIAASWEPWFGFIGGDCAYANGRTPRLWVTYLQLWRENMVDPQGRLIPMICAIGNHEVDGSYGQPREKAPYFLALFDGLFPENSYATLDFGDYLSFVLLDSGHLSSHEQQVDWLKQTLAERQDRSHLFTAYHVPAYPSHRDFEGKYSELARQYWVPLFEEFGVDVSFEHHDHTYKRTHVLKGGVPDPTGVLYMGDGAWGQKGRTVATPEERPYLASSAPISHVIRVTLDGNNRGFLAVDVDGNVIDQYPQ